MRLSPHRHSSEGWNPGGRGQDGKQTPVPKGHSRYAGMDCLNHWIPACAGMTEVARIKVIKVAKMRLPPHRHSSESSPTGM